ncbi:terminase [Phototrophicus methaneseepsis]|uniref:Terminase n=1 Tax=Phototrophicus methaneseepsis TaxID=2710758 RepID=A0A7S8E846_9CHLR|nr:phage terminase large subunit [Phototrophicus methaneseepsis]QPC82102.1 terminase [Phototrophicus methaneseepsis]
MSLASPSREPRSRMPESLFRLKMERARQQTKINQVRRRSLPEYELRGNNLALQTAGAGTYLLCGAAGTGKTLAILLLINRLMWEYPGARWVIMRKVRADLAQTTLVTFERDVLGEDNPICANVQREYRQSYKYPNGSEIVVGGMDRPGKILSGEYDGAYCAEAVQFDKLDIETIEMRLRNGVIPEPRLLMDTNPDRPDHWLKQRCDEGFVTLMNTYHKDNPRYWDNKLGQWTAAGVQYVLGALEKLTGLWRDRYRDGKWTLAEGAIFDEYREDVHVVNWFAPPLDWRKYRVIDFGYNHPFVCQWWAEDPDGRLYLYREIYWSERLVQDHAEDIRRMTATAHWRSNAALYDEDIIEYVSREEWAEMTDEEKQRALLMGEQITVSISDHDAEDRATLKRYGIDTKAAYKAVKDGIQLVKSRLRVQDDGKPKLFIMRGATVEIDDKLRTKGLPTSTQSELPGYIWADKSKKEEPLKENDHGADTTRYMVAHLDKRGGKKATSRRRNPVW